MELRIRPLTKEDYNVIVSVIDHWWGGPSTALAHPMFFYELGKLARVAEAKDGDLAGFLLGFVCPDTGLGYVHLVGIHPNFRRQGVGKQLYASFEQACKEEGCSSLKSISTPANEGSIRFHLALGWSMEHDENYAGLGRARVVFTKSLSA